MKRLGRLQVVLLRKSEVYEDRHALIVQEYVRRSDGVFTSAKVARTTRVLYVLDVIVNDSTLVQEVDCREQRAEPPLGGGFADFNGD